MITYILSSQEVDNMVFHKKLLSINCFVLCFEHTNQNLLSLCIPGHLLIYFRVLDLGICNFFRVIPAKLVKFKLHKSLLHQSVSSLQVANLIMFLYRHYGNNLQLYTKTDHFKKQSVKLLRNFLVSSPVVFIFLLVQIFLFSFLEDYFCL